MASKRPPKPPPSKFSLALRGGIAVAVIAGLIVYITIASTGTFSGFPVVTASIPATNAGVNEQAPVEYKGVIVGKVIDVSTRQESSTITMRIYDRQAAGVSADAQVRVLPRTLFGDQFVQLIPPKRETGRGIADGDVLKADTSVGTIQLYKAYVRLTSLLKQVKPAKIAAALRAVSQLLDGRGERFGRMIDQLYDLTGDVPELLKLVDDGMDVATTLTGQLEEATPDGITAMRNAIALSETLVKEKESLHQALTGGIALTTEGRRFLGDNTDRFVHLLRASGPVIDTLADNPKGLPNSVRSAQTLLQRGIPAFESGPWFKIRANLTLEEPRPYTTDDCPRYPGLDGPNCGGSARSAEALAPPNYGGAAGPVGSPAERDALEQLLQGAPDLQSRQSAGEAYGAVALLVGPLVRGAQVITP